jgi:hypothetical protein
MKIGQGCLVASDRRQEKLLPKHGIFVPTGAQFVTLLKSDALDISGAERCDDACNGGRNAQHLDGDARIRAGRVPGQGERFNREFARCLLRKGRLWRSTRRLGHGRSALGFSPPLHAVKSHLNQQKRTLGRAVSCGFIQFCPESPEGTYDVKYLAPARAQFLQHLQGSIVRGVNEVESLPAGPFPGGQGISGGIFIASHDVIVGGAARLQFHGLSGFVSNTPLSQRSASWKIGLAENSDDISSPCE